VTTLRDYFPAYVPFGLRELAVERDDQVVLAWVEEVASPSFDVLSSEMRDGFARYAAMMAE
jgi:hypothetical protein